MRISSSLGIHPSGPRQGSQPATICSEPDSWYDRLCHARGRCAILQAQKHHRCQSGWNPLQKCGEVPQLILLAPHVIPPLLKVVTKWLLISSPQKVGPFRPLFCTCLDLNLGQRDISKIDLLWSMSGSHPPKWSKTHQEVLLQQGNKNHKKLSNPYPAPAISLSSGSPCAWSSTWLPQFSSQAAACASDCRSKRIQEAPRSACSTLDFHGNPQTQWSFESENHPWISTYIEGFPMEDFHFWSYKSSRNGPML